MMPTNLPRFINACFFSAALLLQPGVCAAEYSDQVSLLAEIAAIQRAVAAMHPDEKVRCPDHLADQFVTEANWHYSPYSRDYRRSVKMIETFRIGSYYYANALAHHLNDALKETARLGYRQVVNLRAGFETHAYRFHAAMPEAKFFELDTPATGRLKQEMVQAYLGRLPEHVTYVSVDLQNEPLETLLKAAGYDETESTLFLWTGATYLLPAEAVNGVLAFIGNHAAAGSRIVFDYIPAQTLADETIRRTRFRMALAGEPLKFGIPEKGVEAFLAGHGLSLISDVGANDLRMRYLIRSDGAPDGSPSPCFRVAIAEVPSHAAGSGQYRSTPAENIENQNANDLAGTWTGHNSLGGRLVFRFSPGGVLEAQRTGGRDSSPKAGAYKRSGSKVEGNMGDIDFSGTIEGDHFTGDWRQGMMSAAFTLSRDTKKE